MSECHIDAGPRREPQPGDPDHTFNNRGFKQLNPINGTYGGSVRLFESSAASAPHIWLAALYRDGASSLHLTTADARRLAEQLIWLADHHYQVEP